MLVVLVCAAGAGGYWLSLRYERKQALAQLTSTDPAERKQAAWKIGDDMPDQAAALLEALATEKDSDVREAMIYSAGRCGERLLAAEMLAGGESSRQETADRLRGETGKDDMQSRIFDAARDRAMHDESGYVRAAAWLAAARTDPERSRALLATVGSTTDAWDQIGVAQAWAELADLRGLEVAMHWTVSGNEAQRQVASRALSKFVAPLLEAVGRWPLEADLKDGKPWTPQLVEQVRERIAGLDLNALARDTMEKIAKADRVRRHTAKLNKARDRIRRVLFAG